MRLLHCCYCADDPTGPFLEFIERKTMTIQSLPQEENKLTKEFCGFCLSISKVLFFGLNLDLHVKHEQLISFSVCLPVSNTGEAFGGH